MLKSYLIRKNIFIGFFMGIWLLISMSGYASGVALDKVGHLAPDNEVRGQVVDSLGAPLPGVSVVVKGKSAIGTSTDLNGRYILKVPENSTLVFNMVGFDSQEVVVGKKEVINIKLLESSNMLEETVTVAFGRQKRSDMVGAITSITPGDLKGPTSNLTTTLAGRIAGMIAFQRSGEPGKDNANFFIRGVASFGLGKVDPLMLIDGVESGVTELARLQPDDIASFSVLKDATATALYGSRAANGVILITTKEGKEGKVKISLRGENSWSAATSNIKFADPVSYMQLYNEAALARDPFASEMYSNIKIDGTMEQKDPIAYPATDWQKMLFKDFAVNQRYNLNVSGGGKIARYYVAGSFAQDNGVLNVDKRNNFNNNINLKSYTLRSNVNIDLTKGTELIVRLNGNFDDYVGPVQGGAEMYNRVVNSSTVDFPAFYPVNETNSYIKHIMFGGDRNKAFINPYADLVSGYKDSSRSLMLAQLELKHNLSYLAEGLNFHAMMNTNRISSFDVARQYSPFYYSMSNYDPITKSYSLMNFNEAAATEFLNYTPAGRAQSNSFYLQSTLSYNKTIKNKHALSGLLVYYMQSGLRGDPGSLQLSLASRNLGLSGRATYAYDNRYFAEVNFGYNGSERFYEDKRFGFFPSFGLAWTVSNEKFWEPVKKVVSNFRLRGTYGSVGNDQIGSASDRFFYLSEVSMFDPLRGGRFGLDYGYRADGISILRYSNTGITWEIAKITNLGLEMSFFNQLNVKADFFRQDRSNILMNRMATPATMGLSAPIRANVGESTSEGMELSLDYQQFITDKVWLKLLGNFTYATNRYKVFEEPDYINEPWLSFVGKSFSQPMGFLAERLFVDEHDVANSPPQSFGTTVVAGDIKYKDVNRDGQITNLDKVPIGFPTTPEIVYGFGFSFGFKNFDVSTFFQGVGRESFFISPESIQPFVGGGRQFIKTFADSHYTLENQDIYALWPRLSTTQNANNNQISTWWMRNGSFLRFKQAEIGYSLPVKVARKLKMESMRMYVNGTNLFLLSNFKTWDIEMGGNGLGYPNQRVFNLGLNVTF